MQISIIVAHPRPESLNLAIARAALAAVEANGHRGVLHDLYAERFDPILPESELGKGAALPDGIEAHCREITQTDGIVVVHPNWWGQPPAILKGWIDRVIRPEVAYRFLEGDGGEGVPMGLLKARCAIVFNTSNTVASREAEVFGDPLETLWKNCVFGLCGVRRFRREIFRVVVTSTPEQRRAWLERVREILDECFPAQGRSA